MKYTKLPHGNCISCIDWCDLRNKDIHLGVIKRNVDGYWRFEPNGSVLTCSHLTKIAYKVSQLNKEGECHG